MLKSKLIKMFMVIFILGLLPSVTFAQNMKKWNWKAYNISFKIPSHWKINKKNSKQMIIDSNADAGMSLTIEPWKDKRATVKQVAKRGFDKYNIKNKKIIGQRAISAIGGMKVWLILAEGSLQNKKVNFASVGMIDPRSPVNVYAKFSWWAGHKDAGKATRLVEKISKSFKLRNKRRGR